MTLSRTVVAVSAVLVLLATAACGDDDDQDDDNDSLAPATTTTETSPAATATGTLETEDDPGEFELDTADDSVDVDGMASECDNPDESTLTLTFTDEGTTVTADVSGGTGSVTVSGGTEFEGRITSFQVGDDGTVNASGTGTLADPGFSPTTFTLVGRC